MTFKINKEYLIDAQPDSSVKNRVMERVCAHTGKKTTIFARYKHRYKITVLPVLGVFFVLGGLLWYNNSHSSLEQEIATTKNMINDFVAMNDYEIL